MQQINLYQDEFKVHYDRRLTGAAIALALMVLVFGGVTLVQVFSVSQLENELAEKNAELNAKKQGFAALEKSAKPKAIDMALAANLANMKRSNSEKLRALNYLSGNDAGNMTGFSFLMQGLGRKRDTINDLWLKKIQFNKGGYDMRLTGSSYQADLLPQFVQALSGEEIYQDREFKTIKISRTEDKKSVFDFVLDTRESEIDGKNEASAKSLAFFVAKLKLLSETTAGEN